MACPTRSAACWRRARSSSKACRTSSSRPCASSCPIPRISRTWTPPSRASCARSARASRSWCSATTTSMAPPRRRCWRASSAAVGGNVAVYIPDRRKEGYGPNTPALLGIKEQGAAVVITVDCGITAFEPLAEAKRAGLDLIVIDHHMAEIALPAGGRRGRSQSAGRRQPAQADRGGRRGLPAGVGVNRALREAGWYGDAQPSPTCANGSTSWPSARCAMSCP